MKLEHNLLVEHKFIHSLTSKDSFLPKLYHRIFDIASRSMSFLAANFEIKKQSAAEGKRKGDGDRM